jgi:hypothetical protein
VKKAHRLEQFCDAKGASWQIGIGKYLFSRGRRHSACRDRRSFTATQNILSPSAVTNSTNIDSHSPQEALRMGLPQHGQMHGQPIAARGGDAGRHSLHLRVGPNDQDRVGKRGPVAISGLHRFGEPRKIAS